MVEFLLTNTVHQSADALRTYLSTPEHVAAVLPPQYFRAVRQTGPAALGLEHHFLGRWWRVDGTLEPGVATHEAQGEQPLVIWKVVSPVPMQVEWRAAPLKRDRRGERVTLRLRLTLALPGGVLGRMLEKALVERPLLACWDAVLRSVVVALEGIPRSGLKHEA